MPESLLIPMFPLTLLPLPGELVPLHIFEPRYRQLLEDAQTPDFVFGIFLNHDCNKMKLGSMMKLESVIRRYPGGESDIVVRCTDLFFMDKLLRTYKTRLYPGGEIRSLQVDPNLMPGAELCDLFSKFQQRRKINRHLAAFTLFEVAAELNLDVYQRYKLMSLPAQSKETFLINEVKLQLHVLHQTEQSRDVFHLN